MAKNERIWDGWNVPRGAWVFAWSVGNRLRRGEAHVFLPGKVRGVGRAAGVFKRVPKGDRYTSKGCAIFGNRP